MKNRNKWVCLLLPLGPAASSHALIAHRFAGGWEMAALCKVCVRLGSRLPSPLGHHPSCKPPRSIGLSTEAQKGGESCLCTNTPGASALVVHGCCHHRAQRGQELSGHLGLPSNGQHWLEGRITTGLTRISHTDRDNICFTQGWIQLTYFGPSDLDCIIRVIGWEHTPRGWHIWFVALVYLRRRCTESQEFLFLSAAHKVSLGNELQP